MTKESLIQELLVVHSRKHADYLANIIYSRMDLLPDLLTIVLGSDILLSQRAVWVLRLIEQINPSLITPYHYLLIKNLSKTPIHDAIKRNTLSIFENKIVSLELQAYLINFCFSAIQSSTEKIAIKAYSISIIGNYLSIYPELKSELVLSLKDVYYCGSPVIKSRIRKLI